LVDPITEFFKRNGWQLAIGMLAFIFLFKIGEAFLGRMSIVFYKEVGFSNDDIAVYSKMVNWWVTIIFAILGSFVNLRLGIVRGLMLGGIAMAGSNLMFAWIAGVGPNTNLLLAAVIIDGFTAAWSTVAFVAFISLLANRAFTATQYALFASLGNLGRTLLSSYSGYVVNWLDGNWQLFFILTAVMVIPSLIILFALRKSLTRLEQNYHRELE
jgi:PAT family beta-lactamase induction signal transducer AmpG